MSKIPYNIYSYFPTVKTKNLIPSRMYVIFVFISFCCLNSKDQCSKNKNNILQILNFSEFVFTLYFYFVFLKGKFCEYEIFYATVARVDFLF